MQHAGGAVISNALAIGVSRPTHSNKATKMPSTRRIGESSHCTKNKVVLPGAAGFFTRINNFFCRGARPPGWEPIFAVVAFVCLKFFQGFGLPPTYWRVDLKCLWQ